MKITVKYGCDDVDWILVAETLKAAGMAHHQPELHRRAFEASHTTVFVFSENRMIGFGRAISDGVYQAAVYDVAVNPEYQRKGVGAAIMEGIMQRIGHCNVILYASPGKEGFYQRLGFSRMKTGMAHFIKSSAMQERGFTE